MEPDDNASTITSGSTLGTYCFRYMFQGCSNLKASKLPLALGGNRVRAIPTFGPTTLKNYCYNNMFTNTAIQLKTACNYNPVQVRVPSIGTGTSTTGALTSMFPSNGSGNFYGTPSINTMYYDVDSDVNTCTSTQQERCPGQYGYLGGGGEEEII
jgi:hypothetical protein